MTPDLCIHAACAVTSSGPCDIPPEFARPLRRADALTRMAVSAVWRCMAVLERNAVSADFSRCAVISGLGMGTLETNLAFVDSLYENDAGSPTLFSHSVHNTVAGYISRLFDIRGPAFTITDFTWPFLTALSEARCCISVGMADMAIVLGAEMESHFMRAMHSQLLGTQAASPVQWETGAVAWIVASPGVVAAPAVLLNGPDLSVCACRPEELLLRLTERYAGKTQPDSGMPFGYVFSLNNAVSVVLEGAGNETSWEVKADFGSARVVIQHWQA